jgi:outer membrane protein OmpA-like peptidoglycan-associated protein
VLTKKETGVAKRAIAAAALVLAMALGGCGAATRLQIASVPRCTAFFFPVYFADRSAELTPAAAKVIANAGLHSSGCKPASVEVVGLADYKGPSEPNFELSRQRAERVAGALAKAGLPEPTFKISAIGEAGAYKADGTPKPLRRRAEVTIRFAP